MFSWKVLSYFVRANKLALVVGRTSENFGNILAIEKELSRRNIKYSLIEDQTHLKNVLTLMRSSVVVLDQSSKLLSLLGKRPGQKVVQIWHGGGLLKKVAFDAKRKNFSQNTEIRRINRIHGYYDYLICQDKKVINKYAEMFDLNINNVKPFGSPRLDQIIQIDQKNEREVLINHLHSNGVNFSNNSLIILIAPTFWNSLEKSLSVIKRYDEIISELNFTAVFLLKKHPNIKNTQIQLKNLICVDDYDYLRLLGAVDVLITDFSSIIFDYSYFNKKALINVEYLNEYINSERELYINPESIVGKDNILHDFKELPNIIKSSHPVGYLWDRFMSSNDGYASKKIVDFLISLK